MKTLPALKLFAFVILAGCATPYAPNQLVGGYSHVRSTMISEDFLRRHPELERALGRLILLPAIAGIVKRLGHSFMKQALPRPVGFR